MKKISKKNYVVLVILLLVTVVLTISLADIYKRKDRFVSAFYEYANKINSSEFDEYINENSDLIIYISDKYDLSKENFETKFKNKLDELNLKNNLVFIDKSSINEKFLNNFEKNYNLKIDIKKTPIVIVIIDKKVVKSLYITPNSNANTIIEYEAFQ